MITYIWGCGLVKKFWHFSDFCGNCGNFWKIWLFSKQTLVDMSSGIYWKESILINDSYIKAYLLKKGFMAKEKFFRLGHFWGKIGIFEKNFGVDWFRGSWWAAPFIPGWMITYIWGSGLVKKFWHFSDFCGNCGIFCKIWLFCKQTYNCTYLQLMRASYFVKLRGSPRPNVVFLYGLSGR